MSIWSSITNGASAGNAAACGIQPRGGPLSSRTAALADAANAEDRARPSPVSTFA